MVGVADGRDSETNEERDACDECSVTDSWGTGDDESVLFTFERISRTSRRDGTDLEFAFFSLYWSNNAASNSSNQKGKEYQRSRTDKSNRLEGSSAFGANGLSAP